MRIVHLIRSDGWAGVERHVAALARQQVAEGDTVHVIGGDQATMARWLDGTAATHRPAVTVLDGVRALRDTAAQVVHAHMTAAEIAAAVSPASRRTPLVTTRHFAGPRGTGLLRRTVAGLCARRIDAQIAVSRYVADHVEGPSTVVYSGVEDGPDARPGAARDRVVLVAQRLEAEKHTDDALRAFATSGLADDGWRLEVAGAGSLARQLAGLADALGVSGSVDFLGHRGDVMALMQRAAVFLATRTDEAFGLSVVEAMAAGTPVVATRAGGHLETVGRHAAAALFPSRDVAAAAAALAELAHDVARRDTYGAELQAIQRTHFTLSAQSAATRDVYRSVVGG